MATGCTFNDFFDSVYIHFQDIFVVAESRFDFYKYLINRGKINVLWDSDSNMVSSDNITYHYIDDEFDVMHRMCDDVLITDDAALSEEKGRLLHFIVKNCLKTPEVIEVKREFKFGR